ncbi:alpha/beta hydrolase [bacterium]|nr:alpha/beta hydrolase [bacterium]
MSNILSLLYSLWTLVLLCAPIAAAPRIELEPCPRKITVSGAQCGTLEVYEDRAAQSGRTIALNIAVLPAFSRSPRPDPLFAFNGGPGGASTDLARMADGPWRRIRQERDIVLIDQRGTGESGPLDCASDDPDSLMFLPEAIEWSIDQLKNCLDGYEADTRLYTTPIAMDDIDEVRRALGYDQINLWGGSYGTRAALVYMRRHPASVRAAIVDGLAPPSMRLPVHMGTDGQRALDMLCQACAADPSCAEAFGDIGAKFDSLQARLQRDPGKVLARFQDPRTGADHELPVYWQGIAGVVRAALYKPEIATLLPLIIDRAYAGDYGPLVALAVPQADVADKISQGMFYSVVCSEDLPFVTDAERRGHNANFFGPFALELMSRICGFWPQGDIPDNYHDPVATDHPVLVLSGNLDPVTPPRWGEDVASHLPNARHVVVPGVGHGTAYGCVPKLMAEFIANADAHDLDTSCIDKLERPAFFTTYLGPAPEEDTP